MAHFGSKVCSYHAVGLDTIHIPINSSSQPGNYGYLLATGQRDAKEMLNEIAPLMDARTEAGAEVKAQNHRFSLIKKAS